MAGKTINVKVSRVKIIDALQNRLDVLTKLNEEYQKAEKQHEEDVKKWEFQVAELALKSDKATHKSTRVAHHYYDEYADNRDVEITISLPKSVIGEKPERPESPFKSSGYGRNYVSGNFSDMKEELQNAIRILQLSDEEVVSTSTYQSVSRYL
jgi:hypothetical protein